MDWNWLQSILFGLICGISEILPVSSEAHHALFALLTGSGEEVVGLRLACRIGTLMALLLSCKSLLIKLRRERRLAKIPEKKRKRHPDRRSLLDMRIASTAVIPLMLSFLLYLPVKQMEYGIWLTAILLALNGVLIYVHQFFPQGNKESQTMSALDALAFGAGGILGIFPGFSRIGGILTVGRMRGVDGPYALDLALLLCVPALAVMCGMDAYILLATGGLRIVLLVYSLLAAAAAFVGAYFSVSIMRFLAVKAGFSGFAYYCWGVALFSFILYLTI